MADNTSQGGADVIATDDLTSLNGSASNGVKVQRVKVGHGLDGDFTDASSTNPLPVKQTHGTVGYGVIGTSTSGDTTLVAPTGSNRVKVIGINLTAASAVSVTFKDGTVAQGQASLTGSMAFVANGGFNDRGSADLYLFQTSAGKSLVLNLNAAVYVGGYFSYIDEA